MKQIDGPLVIVWISIFGRPKLLLSVRCFGQNSNKKVLPHWQFGERQPWCFGL